MTKLIAVEDTVRGEFDSLLYLGKRLRAGREKFAVLLHRLYFGEVNGIKKYQHLGFTTAEEMLQNLAEQLQPTDRTLGNWRSVLLLEESTVRNLEDLSKCYQAARLKRAGVWKSWVAAEWKDMTLEAVKAEVQKTLSPLAEGTRRLTFVISESLLALWEDQLERVRQETGVDKPTTVFEFLLNELVHLSNRKLRDAMKGRGA